MSILIILIFWFIHLGAYSNTVSFQPFYRIRFIPMGAYSRIGAYYKNWVWAWRIYSPSERQHSTTIFKYACDLTGPSKRKREVTQKKVDYLFSVERPLFKKMCALTFLLEICHILFFLFRKVCKMILNLLDNFKESVNHAFF